MTTASKDGPNAAGRPDPLESSTLPAETVWLDQIQASAFIMTMGVRRAPKTLQKARVFGIGSPPFRKVLGRVVYERAELRTWAEAQRSPAVTSTSELPPKAA